MTGNGIIIEANKIECGADGFSFIVNDGHIDVDLLTLQYVDATSTYISAEHTIIAENISLDINEIIDKCLRLLDFWQVVKNILKKTDFIFFTL